MKIERFEVAGLAQYSYIVSDAGEAIVIDAIRDIDRYVEYLAANNLRLTHILETHIHADFAAGSVELAEATGAQLAFSAYDEGEKYVYAMPHLKLGDGDSLQVGALRIEARHTPGHTPEHLAYLLYDESKSGREPIAMFSGDFIFVGSLGRPDLLGEDAKLQLAHELYRSTQKRISDLPDGLLIYPAHGAGSLCGAGMSERPETSLGYEGLTNPYFLYSEQEFVEKILASVPPMPDYYPRMKVLNAQGSPALHGVPGAKALTVDEVDALKGDAGVVLLDLRGPEAFAGAHIEGAINIGGGQNLSLWAGWLLDAAKKIVLIGDGTGPYEEARRSLVRVGLDNIAGFLGMSAWIADGRDFVQTRLMSVGEVGRRHGELYVLDVRSGQEFSQGAIRGAHHVMLGDLQKKLAEVPRDASVLTVCGSGYRSSIAASILERSGFKDVSSMDGGMMAWMRRSMPLTR